MSEEIQVPGEDPSKKARAKKPEAKPGLPDQADIDPAKISRAVLSKDGWVCPLKHGKQ